MRRYYYTCLINKVFMVKVECVPSGGVWDWSQPHTQVDRTYSDHRVGNREEHSVCDPLRVGGPFWSIPMYYILQCISPFSLSVEAHKYRRKPVNLQWPHRRHLEDANLEEQWSKIQWEWPSHNMAGYQWSEIGKMWMSPHVTMGKEDAILPSSLMLWH